MLTLLIYKKIASTRVNRLVGLGPYNLLHFRELKLPFRGLLRHFQALVLILLRRVSCIIDDHLF